MGGRLERVLTRLESQACSKADVRVLVAPPLTARAFRAQQRHVGLLPWSRRYREFARYQQEVKSYDPAEYEEVIGVPALANLSLLVEEKVPVLPDATFSDYDSVLRDPNCRLLFLVAHHMRNVGRWFFRDLGPGIEFADGGYPWGILERSLEAATRNQPLSLVFAVCETEEFVRDWYGRYAKVGALAFVGWQVDFQHCVELVRRWVLQLDGQRTIADAYDRVTEEIIAAERKRTHDP